MDFKGRLVRISLFYSKLVVCISTNCADTPMSFFSTEPVKVTSCDHRIPSSDTTPPQRCCKVPLPFQLSGVPLHKTGLQNRCKFANTQNRCKFANSQISTGSQNSLFHAAVFHCR